MAARIPYEILVENCRFDSLPTTKQTDTKRALYDYFLLCDEQLSLVNGRTFRKRKYLGPLSRLGTQMQIRDVRVWEQAEREWTEGIAENFKRHAIQEAFHEISRQLNPEQPEECFTAIHRNILDKDPAE